MASREQGKRHSRRKPAFLFRLQGLYRQEVSANPTLPGRLLSGDVEANQEKFCSLGWMEFRTTLAKVIWTFDLELVNRDLDWHRDSRMHSLWVKPNLLVTAKLAKHNA